MIATFFDTFATPMVIALMAAACYLIGREDGRDAEADEWISWAQEQRDRRR